MTRLAELRRNGAEVFLTRGPHSGGIQHSKVLYVDGRVLLGSTNWTNSSRSNFVMNVLIELSAEGEMEFLEQIHLLRARSELLTLSSIRGSSEERAKKAAAKRSKSAEPRQQATESCFSIAESRRRTKNDSDAFGM